MHATTRPVSLDDLNGDLMRHALRSPGSLAQLDLERILALKVLRVLAEQIGVRWSEEERDSLLLPFLEALRDRRLTYLTAAWFHTARRNYRSEQRRHGAASVGSTDEHGFDPAGAEVNTHDALVALARLDLPGLRQRLNGEQRALLDWAMANDLDRGWAPRAAADLGWVSLKPYRVYHALLAVARRYYDLL